MLDTYDRLILWFCINVTAINGDHGQSVPLAFETHSKPYRLLVSSAKSRDYIGPGEPCSKLKRVTPRDSSPYVRNELFGGVSGNLTPKDAAAPWSTTKRTLLVGGGRRDAPSSGELSRSRQ